MNIHDTGLLLPDPSHHTSPVLYSWPLWNSIILFEVSKNSWKWAAIFIISDGWGIVLKRVYQIMLNTYTTGINFHPKKSGFILFLINFSSASWSQLEKLSCQSQIKKGGKFALFLCWSIGHGNYWRNQLRKSISCLNLRFPLLFRTLSEMRTYSHWDVLLYPEW